MTERPPGSSPPNRGRRSTTGSTAQAGARPASTGPATPASDVPDDATRQVPQQERPEETRIMAATPPSQAKVPQSAREIRRERAQRTGGDEPRATRPTPPPVAPPPGSSRSRFRFRFRWRYVWLLLLLWLVFLVVVPLIAWNKVSKIDAEPTGQRPGDEPGFDVPARRQRLTCRPVGGGAQGAQHRQRRRRADRHDHAAAHRRRAGRADVDPPRLAGADPRPRHQQDQRGVRLRWPQAAGPHHRAEHRHPDRRLRRDRLRWLRRSRRRGGRHRGLSEGGHGRRRRQPGHQEGLPGRRRRGRARLRPLAARPAARRPRPHRPPARGRLRDR